METKINDLSSSIKKINNIFQFKPKDYKQYVDKIKKAIYAYISLPEDVYYLIISYFEIEMYQDLYSHLGRLKIPLLCDNNESFSSYINKSKKFKNCDYKRTCINDNIFNYVKSKLTLLEWLDYRSEIYKDSHDYYTNLLQFANSYKYIKCTSNYTLVKYDFKNHIFLNDLQNNTYSKMNNLYVEIDVVEHNNRYCGMFYIFAEMDLDKCYSLDDIHNYFSGKGHFITFNMKSTHSMDFYEYKIEYDYINANNYIEYNYIRDIYIIP